MTKALPVSDLTEVESQIKHLLLEIADHISTLKDHRRPELRFAGGWVRDKLLGINSDDIDVCIDNMTGYQFANATKDFISAKYDPEQAQQILGKLGKIEMNPEKSKHLETAVMRVHGLSLDFVNLRKEVYHENSRTPTMEFGTAKDDALRRDSTVNSLFYNLTTSCVEDFTGKGLEDLTHKVIRTPLKPFETFRDDPLRVLRHIRFASRLGFTIAPEDERAMSEPNIQQALKLKISRERVGVEIFKIFNGPNPSKALQIIEKVGLYDIVFTPLDTNPASTIETISRFRGNLLESEARYSAWLLFALTPWAKMPSANSEMQKSKVRTAAGAVARNGLKAPNDIIKLVDNASLLVDEIHALVAGAANNDRYVNAQNGQNGHIHDQAEVRKTYGKAIRRWGAQWRLCVLYAMFVRLFETNSADWQGIIAGYMYWLSQVDMLKLSDVCSLKPLANGTELQKALGVKGGLWTKEALDMIIEWQLLNPDEIDPKSAIAEVQRRSHELGLTG